MSHRLAFALSVACFLLACGNDTGAPATSYGPLLGTLGEQVILPEHQAFVTESAALVVALQALADSPSADTLSAAQSAWRTTRQAFRTLDALNIGPDNQSGIHDRIDVAPVNGAGIEAMASSTGAVDDAAVGNAGGQKKGFLGLEYLLFPDPGASAPAPVLAEDAAAPRRRTLAVSMADEIAKAAGELDDAWEPGKGAFVTELETAGSGSKTYRTQQAAVQVLVNGMSQALELVVAQRLAIPLGRKNHQVPDPTQDPTSRSDNSVADMLATLGGVTALYSGTGFSAAVQGKSAELDTVVLSELSDAATAVTAIPAPFTSALTADTSVVEAAYTATDALKKTWNTDVFSALGTTLNAGDQDGD